MNRTLLIALALVACACVMHTVIGAQATGVRVHKKKPDTASVTSSSSSATVAAPVSPSMLSMHSQSKFQLINQLLQQPPNTRMQAQQQSQFILHRDAEQVAQVKLRLEAQGPHVAASPPSVWPPVSSIAFIDLDILDANLLAVRKVLGNDTQLRLVTKSLPSVPLLRYITDRLQLGGTQAKMMVFHQGLLLDLIAEYGTSADYLWGQPASARQCAAILAQLGVLTREEQKGANKEQRKAHRQAVAALNSIQWLLDSSPRLAAFLTVAKQYGVQLRINVEIDVGLHRGGAIDPSYAMQMIDTIVSNPSSFVLSGFMGYDGHVQFDPWFPTAGPDLFMSDLDRVLQVYRKFQAQLASAYPSLFNGDVGSSALSFNGAGSTTFSAYQAYHANGTSPLNDYSFGSLLLKPEKFDLFTTDFVQPCLFVAGFLLKGMGQRDPVPFLDDLWKFYEYFDALTYCQGAFVVNIGCTQMDPIDPQLSGNPWMAVENSAQLMPTAGLVHANCTVNLQEESFTFWYPWQADSMIAYDFVYGISNISRLTDVWANGRGAESVDQLPIVEQTVVAWETYRKGL